MLFQTWFCASPTERVAEIQFFVGEAQFPKKGMVTTMNMKETILMKELSEEGVIVCTNRSVELDGKTVSVSSEQKYYPNSIHGRTIFLEECGEQESIVTAVLAIWGETAIVDESDSEQPNTDELGTDQSNLNKIDINELETDKSDPIQSDTAHSEQDQRNDGKEA